MVSSKSSVSLLCASLLMYAQSASAAVENGGFESWSANTPHNWSVIDSGITLSASSSIVKEGQYSAEVVVGTATQANTDLQQVVNVVAGEQYTFSTWVYHTKGTVRARLIANGYQSYSDPNLVNQWQQLSYQYTASESGTINVGLRFYDVSGFSGQEVVYVDGFLPSKSGTPNPPTPPTGCQGNTVNLTLNTDNYGEETSWQLTNQQGATLASGDNYASNQQHQQQLCLADGSYTFTIKDSYGDGMCCNYGQGSYSLVFGGTTLASGARFSQSQSHSFKLGAATPPPTDPSGYYVTAQGLRGYALKTELHNIIRIHSNQGYGAIWGFYDQYSRDKYFDNDDSILNRYGENPTGQDGYVFSAVSDQCGISRKEGDCYNREHSFPKSWFGGKVEPMNSDIHHIFAADGYVNTRRSSYPFGEVASATYVSNNGSKVGAGTASSGYTGTVFEPIDQFKGDFARAYFYMATRYQDVVSSWQSKSSHGDAVLNGSVNQVFEPWVVSLLVKWHKADPVDKLEKDRNQAAFEFQGNRNPFVDHPEFVEMIWH